MNAPNPQRVLITGASSGLGRALALWLAKKDLTVYAAGRRLEQLESLAASAPERIRPFTLDVADADAAHDAVKELDRTSGGLDLVIANAGVGDSMSAKSIEWRRVRKVLDVNVMGATATLCGALPGMLERGRGHLVGISSLAAFLSLPKTAAYNASKTYLTAWLESVRLDVEGHGVAVTTIHPGFVRTEMTAKNKHPMPFIIDADDAAERMGRAILKRTKMFSYPLPTSLVVGLASSLPRPLQRALGRRVN
ncbi:MAG: SDR family NAD(P)-dependent oxidoreductase [Myxococcaceae bacterium]|nr:SDR family NAD(P)-dependent oxidoreductase [Myxococcaceae bacterium]